MGYTLLMRVRMTEVYRDWINSLRDRVGRARIQVRVDRLAHGNPGQPGGDKSTQQQDIETAISLARNL
jgi:putative component of toxin-antitoxin plasmid stabilization module